MEMFNKETGSSDDLYDLFQTIDVISNTCPLAVLYFHS